MNPQDVIDILTKHLKRTQLFADDFPHGPVRIRMIEGSQFRWFDAFMIEDKEKEKTYVFTEHYGYHAFDSDLITKASGPTKPKGKSNGI
jgi:hypothetical protein